MVFANLAHLGIWLTVCCFVDLSSEDIWYLLTLYIIYVAGLPQTLPAYLVAVFSCACIIIGLAVFVNKFIRKVIAGVLVKFALLAEPILLLGLILQQRNVWGHFLPVKYVI